MPEGAIGFWKYPNGVRRHEIAYSAPSGICVL